jgi:hypothetical protein
MTPVMTGMPASSEASIRGVCRPHTSYLLPPVGADAAARSDACACACACACNAARQDAGCTVRFARVEARARARACDARACARACVDRTSGRVRACACMRACVCACACAHAGARAILCHELADPVCVRLQVYARLCACVRACVDASASKVRVLIMFVSHARAWVRARAWACARVRVHSGSELESR